MDGECKRRRRGPSSKYSCSTTVNNFYFSNHEKTTHHNEHYLEYIRIVCATKSLISTVKVSGPSKNLHKDCVWESG